MVISLDQSKNAQTYHVQRINDDTELKRQLVSRGFVRGALLKVVRSQGTGPLLVEIKHARIALGRAEAAKIMVRIADPL